MARRSFEALLWKTSRSVRRLINVVEMNREAGSPQYRSIAFCECS